MVQNQRLNRCICTSRPRFLGPKRMTFSWQIKAYQLHCPIIQTMLTSSLMICRVFLRKYLVQSALFTAAIAVGGGYPFDVRFRYNHFSEFLECLESFFHTENICCGRRKCTLVPPNQLITISSKYAPVRVPSFQGSVGRNFDLCYDNIPNKPWKYLVNFIFWRDITSFPTTAIVLLPHCTVELVTSLLIPIAPYSEPICWVVSHTILYA